MNFVAKAKITAHNDSLKLDGARRATEIVRLRARNLPWTAISREIGISEGACKNVWTRELKRFREEATVGVEDHVDAQLLVWDERLAQLQADLIEARTVDSVAQRISLISKVETAIARVEQMRIDLLGLKAPEFHAHLHGAAPSGLDIPIADLEAMSDDELARMLDGQRTLQAVETTPEVIDEEYDRDDDEGAPAEVVIEDPGPRAIAPATSDEESDVGE